MEGAEPEQEAGRRAREGRRLAPGRPEGARERPDAEAVEQEELHDEEVEARGAPRRGRGVRRGEPVGYSSKAIAGPKESRSDSSRFALPSEPMREFESASAGRATTVPRPRG